MSIAVQVYSTLPSGFYLQKESFAEPIPNLIVKELALAIHTYVTLWRRIS